MKKCRHLLVGSALALTLLMFSVPAASARTCPPKAGVFPQPPRDRVTGSARCDDPPAVLAAIREAEWSGKKIRWTRKGESYTFSTPRGRWRCVLRIQSKPNAVNRITCRRFGKYGTLVTYRVQSH